VLAQLPLHLLDLGERLLVAPPHVQPFAHRGSVASIPAGDNRLQSPMAMERTGIEPVTSGLQSPEREATGEDGR
jgi:hypothetical protein